MNFIKHPLFIMSALSLVFPIGLILLLISDQPSKQKWIMGLCGLLIFLLLISIAFLYPSKSAQIHSFDLVVTKNELTVGQSGGLAVIAGTRYLTEYTVSANSDVLAINNNVYTAQRIGSALLTVSHNGIKKSIQINVIEGNSSIETVYFSPTGKRYHKNAEHAGKNAIEMTEEDALQAQKSPCKVCYK